MRLQAGSRLGPYEILAPLGAGGMGEVYRARDSRLGREVALKVLPGEFSGDSARRARFEQEARAAAALSHPNIVGLHDIGVEGDVSYLVGELVPGETLTDLIQRGPVPVRKLLDIAVQIADGMSAAHAARITHRDLKPANIMLTPEGRVKILDFGLAKQAPLPSSSPDDTMTVQQTTPGMILGTVHYMSPEQARGTPADHRSDQFSFGLILYEMATGKKAFDKPETIMTMSAILSEDPPPIEVPIPEPLRWAIDRCLAKQPADRYESTSDLYRELKSIRDHLSAGSVTSATRAVVALPAPKRRPWWPWAGAAAIALGTAFAAGLYLSGPRFPDQSAYRFTPFASGPGGQGLPVWSPDGKAVAYGAVPGTNTADPFQIFVRYLDSPVAAQVTHIPEQAEPMVWAPDGKRILFSSRRAPQGIWSVSSAGGEPESFMPLTGVYAVTIAPDLQSVAFVARGEDGLFSVWISSPPGSPRRKYLPDPVASTALFNDSIMRFSPDGKSLLLFVNKNHDEAWVLPYPPGSGKPKLVFPGMHSFSGTPTWAWMPDSRHVVLCYQPTEGEATQLWLADTVSGEQIALTSGTNGKGSTAVSPDGHKIIFVEVTGSFDVVSVDLEHATARPLIATELTEFMPAWAYKQPLLAYVTNRNGKMEIWLHSPSGADRPLVTARDFPADTTQWFVAPALSPEGDRVIYSRIGAKGHSQNWMSAVSGGAPVPLTNDSGTPEYPGSWSPDGAWFVYRAVRGGKQDLMKVKTTGQATPVLVKSGVSGEVPVWSPTGDSILTGNELLSLDGAVLRDLGNHHTANYAFSADGKLLYGLRHEGDKELLFSLDAGGVERVIGDVGMDFAPGGSLHPGIRFSLAPDGKSFAYASGRFKANLWLLEGWAEGLKGWGIPKR